MAKRNESSVFTTSGDDETPFGPPLIGALLRIPWEAVQQHMLERLHESDFGDFDVAYLTVFQYPGPQGARPSELAARLRISKQALNYLLGELERLGYLERRADPDDLRSKRIALTPRGIAAVGVIREAVGEVETAWAQRLGAGRFDELRNLLLELTGLT
ncbi:MAG: MarR family transcriptional regulator [Thermoleophilia bacterium]|nr:MarR family transcriptional regulator [Thermoleophilia bacterium]MDH4339675.1 MarR family transcriptional regulator [Thermoleophilia bacterium]MDH5282122.1 MarR family transcriptional regulator [Thermoleophilia bacterium]